MTLFVQVTMQTAPYSAQNEEKYKASQIYTGDPDYVPTSDDFRYACYEKGKRPYLDSYAADVTERTKVLFDQTYPSVSLKSFIKEPIVKPIASIVANWWRWRFPNEEITSLAQQACNEWAASQDKNLLTTAK